MLLARATRAVWLPRVPELVDVAAPRLGGSHRINQGKRTVRPTTGDSGRWLQDTRSSAKFPGPPANPSRQPPSLAARQPDSSREELHVGPRRATGIGEGVDEPVSGDFVLIEEARGDVVLALEVLDVRMLGVETLNSGPQCLCTGETLEDRDQDRRPVGRRGHRRSRRPGPGHHDAAHSSSVED